MYIHIVTPKIHVSTTFTTFIYFCFISKEKMKKNDFFFLKYFRYAWCTREAPFF